MIPKKLLVLGAGTVLFLCVVFFVHTFFPLVETAFYDSSFGLSRGRAPANIVIVGIDPKSIGDIGAFPWPRSTIARLVAAVEQAGPRALALDFLFPARPDDPAANDSLEAAFASVNNLVLPFRAGQISNGSGRGAALIPHEALGFAFQLADDGDRFAHDFFYSTENIDVADPRFVAHAKFAGFLNVSTVKGTQKLREVIHVIKAGGEYFPSFGMAAAAAYLGVRADQLTLDALPKAIVGKQEVPLSSYAGSALLNFKGGQGTIQTVSASDVLKGAVDAPTFRDKLVFVGITDPAEGVDFFITPVSPQFPGVEIWATAASDVISGSWLKRPHGVLALVNWLLVLMIFPGLALFVSARKRVLSVCLGVGLVCAAGALWLVLFRSAGVFFNPGYAVYAWFFSLLWLAAQKVDPTLVEVEAVDLEASGEDDADVVAPPAPGGFLSAIPDTPSARFVAERLGLAGAADVSSGTLVEAKLPSAALLEELQKLAGGRIVRILGSGGMADVYLIWNPRLEVYRAVKVIKPGQSAQLLDRFETEIRIIAHLSHRNIVHCYSAGEWQSLPYLEMEYVPGASMDEVLAKCTLLTAGQTIAVGVLVCRALAYAHQQTVTVHGTSYKGVIHRDLKPANIMLSRSGRVKLTDFGIARPQAVSLHTTDAKVVGTLPYLAPEQLDGKELSARTDIYALGVTLYELVTGERAYPQQEVTTLVNAKSKGQIKPVRSSSFVPPSLAAIIEKAMAQEPAQRYESAGAMGKELESALRGHIKEDSGKFLPGLVRRFFG